MSLKTCYTVICSSVYTNYQGHLFAYTSGGFQPTPRHGCMAKKKQGSLFCLTQTEIARIHLSKNLPLFTTCSFCAYSKGILLLPALQNQYYPFKANTPDRIARILSKNCSPFHLHHF